VIPLASSDPSDIANASRCFASCVPGFQSQALKTYLLTQAASISTPPCITVTPPVLKGVNSDPVNGTILQVTWSQLSNSGSFITGYTVFWGTVSGIYTSNSGVRPATPHQYVITGLNPGTTYFVAVVANTNIAGCQSANSNEKSNTTSGAPAICATGTTFANAWATRVVANGGVAPSQATKDAIANFQCGLITDGLDTLMISWNAIVPDNLIAAKTPQLVGTGGDDPWNDGGGFVGGDLTVNGLKATGNPGAAKQMATGLNPTTIYASDNDGGITFYSFDNDGGANATSGLTATGIMDLQQFAGSTFSDCYGAGTGRINAADANFTGYVSGNRTAANAHAVYQANSVTPHHTLVSGAGASDTARPNNGGPGVGAGINFWAIGSGGTFSNQRLSFCAIHHGLTSAQSALFFARIQTLRQALGGGFS
jgi:hypothetical protein